MVDVCFVKFFGVVIRRLILRLDFLFDFIWFYVFFIDVKTKYKKTRKFNPKNYISSTVHVFWDTSELRFGTEPPQEEAWHEGSTYGGKTTSGGK